MNDATALTAALKVAWSAFVLIVGIVPLMVLFRMPGYMRRQEQRMQALLDGVNRAESQARAKHDPRTEQAARNVARMAGRTEL